MYYMIPWKHLAAWKYQDITTPPDSPKGGAIWLSEVDVLLTDYNFRTFGGRDSSRIRISTPHEK